LAAASRQPASLHRPPPKIDTLPSLEWTLSVNQMALKVAISKPASSRCSCPGSGSPEKRTHHYVGRTWGRSPECRHDLIPDRPVRATALECLITVGAVNTTLAEIAGRLQRLNWPDPSMHRVGSNDSPRVRMEAWRTGGTARTAGAHHVGLDGQWP